MTVEFKLFGDISVSLNGRPIDVGHARQKIVLAAFLVEPNQLITRETLIEHVWDDRFPQRARETVYGYVSRLKKALAVADLVIDRGSGGYLLTVDPMCIDMHRFRRTVARARELTRDARTADDGGGTPGHSPSGTRELDLFQQALDLWHGRPFGAFDTPRLARLRAGLERERLTAELDRNDLALALGSHASLMGELVAAVTGQPLDERLVGQLMLALSRSGRQAEAQQLYHRTRGLLADELGTDPSRQLQALYLRMLEADPAVDWGPAAPAGGAQARTAARVDVVVYRTATNRLNRPALLVGRDDVVPALNATLDQGGAVLLHGLAGVGKTAIAATVADQRLTAAAKPYMWLRVGEADEEMIFGALARRLGSADEAVSITDLVGDARLLAVQDLLERSGAGLLVLDDVWNGPALYQVLRTVPDAMPVLVTARTKFAMEHQMEVAELPEIDAVRLLAMHAGLRPGTWNPGSAGLCRRLGNHPYAVEIAGRHLRQYRMDPDELLAQIADTPHELAMPAGLAAADRESVKRLLDRSYAAMDDSDSRLVFQAFGTLTYAGASAPLLAALTGLDDLRVRTALRTLADLSLVRRRDTSAFHELHDLTYSYTRALAPAGGRTRSVAEAMRQFAVAHRSDLDVLAPDVDNLLSAAESVLHINEDAAIDIVAAIAVGGYLDDRGHAPTLLRVLDEVISRVRSRPPAGDLLHQLLGKRGNAYLHQGRLPEAAASYEEALRLSPNASRRAILLAVMGRTYADMGQHDRAENTLKMAYEIADAHDDDAARLRILEQHSIAAFRHKDYELVRDLTLRGVEASRRLGARATEAIFLNNLGTAELEIGLIAAFDRHGEAQRIARELNDLDVLALTHHNLGVDWQAAEDADAAAHHLREALMLYERLGHTQQENKVRTLMARFGHQPSASRGPEEAGHH